MYSTNIFSQTLLCVYQEWTSFLASASGIEVFEYAGLCCWGLFENGNWTVIVYDTEGRPHEYTSSSKRELLRDFAAYIAGGQ